MASLVYFLCAATSGACGAFIFRQYRRQPSKFLFWMMVGFFVMFLSQILLVADLVFLPTEIDLSTLRAVVSLLSLIFMIYGFVWEAE
jgi:hypothetical protein